MNRIFRLLNFTFFLFSFLISHSQTNYEDYLASESIFLDDFSNNKNSWPAIMATDSSYVGKIENGSFEITSNRKGSYPYYWITRMIDVTRDFEIEAELLFVKGESDNAISVMWGKNDNGYRYQFGVSGNGKYTISQYKGSWVNIKDWTTSDLVRKSEYNKLSVRKLGANFYFYLNEKLVHSSDFYPFFGNQIGFQDNQNTTMKVNYLKVSYLKSTIRANQSKAPQTNNSGLLKTNRFGGTFGLGYIHSTGEIRDLWKSGFDVDILLGYRILPNFGFECGINYGDIGIASNKKVTVNVTNNYGVHDTRTTSGGNYLSFPIGIKITFPISTRKNFLTIGGGGNYSFTKESGMGDVTDYSERGSSGFGYYARISFSRYDEKKLGGVWGLQIRYTVNNSNVGDFYKNTENQVTKSRAPDAKLAFVLEIGIL